MLNSFKRSLLIVPIVLSILCSAPRASADEGMYPINLLRTLNLRSKGIMLETSDLYNPSGVGLINAVVKIGGCTGSFVSPDGLILTNHHCVFGYVQEASTKEHDFVTNGFLAKSRQEEMRAKGATVRITESYKDVSREVLAAVQDTMDALTRSVAINEAIQKLVADAEKQNPGKRIEIAEMLPGKSYIMFTALIIRDVRIVYVPPRSIGEFGGETDNWVWPRHTGDFSFARAYVAPDGSPADYSPNNVPYHPAKYLHVQPAGVDEGDEVFILGYPARTYRHRPSHYLAYEEYVRMPFIADLYEWEIATMLHAGASDRGIALKYDARVKGLANTSKNYRGKLQGMQRLGLVEQRREEELGLQSFIMADPVRAGRYGHTLHELDSVYAAAGRTALYELTLDNLRPSSSLLGLVWTFLEANLQAIREDTASARQVTGRLRENVASTLRNYDPAGDMALFTGLLQRAAGLPAGQRIAPVDALLSTADSGPDGISALVRKLYEQSRFGDEEFLNRLLADPAAAADELSDDPFTSLAAALAPLTQELRETRRIRESLLSKLQAELIEVKQEFLKKDFIPDANSTLRFTFGKIRGYSPADATYYSPITTVQGVLEKTTGREPFQSPTKLVELAKAHRFGRFALPKLGQVPVALLYDLDTTGGNSGSPLMNARGELVGVNFDRAFEATINDYAWSESYSRSIAVDIRYVLWVTSAIGGAGHLLQEMGVNATD